MRASCFASVAAGVIAAVSERARDRTMTPDGVIAPEAIRFA
jgi:hypothetical protein